MSVNYQNYEKIVQRRTYMREYMRKRALENKGPVRRFPGKPRLNPYFYNGDNNQKHVRFQSGSYRITFD